MTRRPILLIVNPAAGGKPGSGGGGERPSGSELRAALIEDGLRVDIHELAEGDDVTALASIAADEDRDVVVAGGDGTVGPAAVGLLEREASLGIVPLGSFNNLARGAGLPLDAREAIAVIVRGDTAALDAGLAWPLDPATADQAAAPPPDAAVFFEAMGIGLDAVGFGLAEAGQHGIRPALRAARQVLRRSERPTRVTVDGRRLRASSPAITVCNGPYHGFGFALAPDAEPDDGLLDLVVFRRMGRIEVLRHFLSVARGGRRREPRVEVVRFREAVIGAGSDPLPAHADGASIGSTPIGVTVKPGALRIFR